MDNADSSIGSAPLPTPETLRARTSLPMQFLRFIAINFKMLKIIRKEGH